MTRAPTLVWLAGLVTCVLMIGAPLLPPERRGIEPERRRPVASPELREVRRLKAQIARIERDRERARHVNRVVAGRSSESAAPVVTVIGDLPSRGEPLVAALADAERWSQTSRPVATGVVIVDPRERAYRGPVYETMLGRVSGELACVRAWPAYWLKRVTRASTAGHRAAHFLAACSPFALYGEPGPSVEAWFRAGGHLLARGSWGAPVKFRGPQPFTGYPLELATDADLLWRACAAGRSTLCGLAFRRPEPVGRAVFRSTGNRDGNAISVLPGNGVGSLSRSAEVAVSELFFDLREQFGERTVGEFWTSREPVEVAFASAFGVPLEEWLSEWARARVTNPPPPLPRAPNVLLSLACVLALAALACGVQSRRRANV